MERQEFPRLYELREQVEGPESAHAYVAYLSRPSLKGCILKDFREREADLQGLDDPSWKYFKRELVPLLTRKDPKRGWQALCDKLNEAKGYNYLVRIGCREVTFVRRSGARGQKTPDLNRSEKETARMNDGSVGAGFVKLPEAFFVKLKSTLEAARQQMISYCQSSEAKRIAYVIVNYDEFLHECGTEYRSQIDAFMASNPFPGLEVEFDIKPDFYYATA
jgi:hypothetical protein